MLLFKERRFYAKNLPTYSPFATTQDKQDLASPSMAMRTITLLVLAAGAADALLLSGGAASSRTLSHPRMSAADNQPAPARKVKVELLAQRRAAVSGMSPGEEASISEQYTSVEEVKDVGFVGKAKTPLTVITVAATLSMVGLQTNKMYQRRQAQLLAEWTATAMVCLGDASALKSSMREFRTQLGPGPYRGKMFVEALAALSKEKPVGVETVIQLKNLVEVMSIKNSELPQLLITTSSRLQKAPSVLNKLVFFAERAVPAAAASAEIRTRFPKWSAETVGCLQEAMLESYYKELCEGLPAGAAPPAGYDVLGMSQAQATQMLQEVRV